MSRDGDTNTLRISEVFPEDEGEYKCVVSNQGGQVEVRAPLKVLGRHYEKSIPSRRINSASDIDFRYDYISPLFFFSNVVAPESNDVLPTLSPMKDITVLEGDSATFKTQVTGKPKPTVQWYREGALIPQSPDFQVSFRAKFKFTL